MKSFASTHPFFEGGIINGRVLANAGFMTALLTLDPFEEYHFFVTNPDALRQEWSSRAHLPALARGAAKAFAHTLLPEALKKNSYHTLHLSDPVSDYADIQALRNMYAPHTPVTCVNHSISYLKYPARFLALLWEGVSQRDCIGANSHASARALHNIFAYLRTAYTLSHEGPTVRVVPMGVDPARLPPAAQHHIAQTMRATMRERLDAEDTSVLALLFGRIAVYDKMDPQPLLLALHRVQAEYPHADVRLIISGYCASNDRTPDFLRALAAALHLRVTVLPNPTEADKAALYAAADIFVSPSDNIQETFGLTLLEAASAGLPVIAADWNGYRDIILHGETGLLIPTLAPHHTPALDAAAHQLGDSAHHHTRGQRTSVMVPQLAQALSDLALNADTRKRMGAAGYRRLHTHFTWEGSVLQWLEVWEQAWQREGFSRTAHPPTAPSLPSLYSAVPTPPIPFGRIFAHYATGHLTADTRLRETSLGRTVREGKIPWEAAGPWPDTVDTNRARALLVLARNGISTGDIAQRCSLSDIDEESLHALLLWLLKHDMMEVM